MRSADLRNKENATIMQNLIDAVQSNDELGMQNAFQAFADGVAERIREEYDIIANQQDTTVLAARGIRQLTGDETKFYQSWIEAAKSANPRQELANISIAMPETIIDSVLEEMQQSHELLSVVDTVQAEGVIRMIVNASDLELASWKPLTAAYATEVGGKIRRIDLTQCKVTAWIPVSKDMLALGPTWLDNYVRIILAEAAASCLEKGILYGTGVNEPIGMSKDLYAGTESSGAYKDKAAVALTSLLPEEYDAVVANLAVKTTYDEETQAEKQIGYRTVSEVILVVNPVDYLKKVMPATTIPNSLGQYTYGVFPFPTKVIQSVVVPANNAIMGIGKNYFLGAFAGTSGKIEYDDSVQFLEDNRVYTVKIYANGTPKNNTSFQTLDITELKPARLTITVPAEGSGETGTETA